MRTRCNLLNSGKVRQNATVFETAAGEDLSPESLHEDLEVETKATVIQPLAGDDLPREGLDEDLANTAHSLMMRFGLPSQI